MTSAEALEAFLGRLAARDSSENTIRAYRTAIDQYIGYLTKFKATAIILESGKQLVVRLPTGDRSATASIALPQLQAGAEISDLLTRVESDSDCVFVHLHRVPASVRSGGRVPAWYVGRSAYPSGSGPGEGSVRACGR